MANEIRPVGNRSGWLSAAPLLVALVGACGPQLPAAATGAAHAAPADVIEIAFGGDILLGEDMNTYVARHGAAAPLAGVPELGEADLAIVNLESVVAPGADAVDSGHVGDYYFLGRPETLGLIEAARIDAVSTANNHARDFGIKALEQEDELLTAMAMPHPGTGRTIAEACAPAYLEAHGIRVALFAINTTDPAYSAGDGQMGTCYLSLRDHGAWDRTYRTAFAEAHRQADVVLAMPHFRATFEHAPDPIERDVARLLVDLGADAVLGDGAHALQGIEAYKGRPILHDAGSLVFNFAEAGDAALFLLTVSRAGVEGIRTVPLVTERNRTRPADPAEARTILNAMSGWSSTLDTTLTAGSLSLAPAAREPLAARPALNPSGPGHPPAPAAESPMSCTATDVPEDAVLGPRAIGPLTLLGARVARARLDGPALIWLETFWRVDVPLDADLLIAPRAVPQRGAPWQGVHEPCDWAWPTSRWKPGVTYRDRYPLRPPPETQRMLGLPALLSMTGYGRLAISVAVEDQGRSLGQSDELRSVVLDPSIPARVAIGAAVLGAVLVVIGLIAWRRRRLRRRVGRGRAGGA